MDYLLLLVAPGAAVAADYLRRRRRGDEPLGPRPAGELPDTSAALAGSLLLWLVARFGAAALHVDAEIARVGGFPGRMVVGAALNVAIALAFLRAATRGSRRVSVPAWKLVLAGVLGAVVVFAAVSLVSVALQEVYALAGARLPGQEVVQEAKLAHGPDLVASAAAAILMAPFAEEVFFRGLLLPALVRLRGESAALALQAMVFGAIHVVGAWETWPLAIPLAIVGWFSGWLYLRTGSLAAPIVLHATFNAINFAALRLVK